MELLISQVCATWLDFDREQQRLQNPYSSDRSLSQWANIWGSITVDSIYSAERRIPTYSIILFSNLTKFHHDIFVGLAKTAYPGVEGDRAWYRLCGQIFAIVTNPRRYQVFRTRAAVVPVANNMEMIRIISETCKQALPNVHLPEVKMQEEELKYYSIETPDNNHSYLTGPRDSVEPFYNSDRLRNTDELHYGNLRNTDDEGMYGGSLRRTDELVVKAEIVESPGFTNNLPRVKQEP